MFPRIQSAIASQSFLLPTFIIECACIDALVADGALPFRQALRTHLQAMEKARSNPEPFGKADIRFHSIIVVGSGNELFATIMRGLLPTLGIRFADATYLEPELPARILAEHREICEHLEAGRAGAARRSLRRHIQASRSHMLNLLAQSA